MKLDDLKKRDLLMFKKLKGKVIKYKLKGYEKATFFGNVCDVGFDYITVMDEFVVGEGSQISSAVESEKERIFPKEQFSSIAPLEEESQEEREYQLKRESFDK